MNESIPKAKQLFRGDINDAVIRVQKMVGISIDEKWWRNNVGNDGPTEQILERFDREYAKLVAQKRK